MLARPAARGDHRSTCMAIPETPRDTVLDVLRDPEIRHLLGSPEHQGLELSHSRQIYANRSMQMRSEEHTSELQSQSNLVCRLLLEKKKKISWRRAPSHSPTLAEPQWTRTPWTLPPSRYPQSHSAPHPYTTNHTFALASPILHSTCP